MGGVGLTAGVGCTAGGDILAAGDGTAFTISGCCGGAVGVVRRGWGGSLAVGGQKAPIKEPGTYLEQLLLSLGVSLGQQQAVGQWALRRPVQGHQVHMYQSRVWCPAAARVVVWMTL